MFKMKHALVLAAAALSIASQANAQRAREVRPVEVKAEKERLEREALAARSGGSADVNQAASNAINGSGLIKSPSILAKVKEALRGDETLQKMASEAITAQKGKAELRDLAAAQLEGLANLKGIDRGQTAQTIANLDPKVRADQSYYTLVTSVAPAARSWSGQSRLVSTSLLVKSNAHIRDGMSPGEALLAAKGEVEAEINARKEAGKADYKINLDDIFKFCKTV